MKKIVGLFMGFLLFITAAVSVSANEYEVKEGDSLWNIAKNYNMTVDEIMEMNGLITTTIKPKQKLLLAATYTVEEGDSLFLIGKDHKVTVNQLKTWNDLDTDIITVGQTLKIKGSQAQSQASNQTNSPQPEVKSSTAEGKTLAVKATAYTAECKGCSGITATGINLNADRNAKVIAVDPKVIPLGSKVHVEGYGEAIAGDTGGAIKGNRIDLHVPTTEEALNWGVRTVNVTILD